jgi:hypothetical protein
MTPNNFCFCLQNRLIQTSKRGGQRYSDTSPFSIPCWNPCCHMVAENGSLIYPDRNLKISQKFKAEIALKMSFPQFETTRAA